MVTKPRTGNHSARTQSTTSNQLSLFSDATELGDNLIEDVGGTEK
jgi:hypothetical protein